MHEYIACACMALGFRFAVSLADDSGQMHSCIPKIFTSFTHIGNSFLTYETQFVPFLAVLEKSVLLMG